MKKMRSVLFLFFIGLVAIVISGCSLTGAKKQSNVGAIIKTSDGGLKWESIVKIDAEKNIGGTSVLSLTIDPLDMKRVYIGTEKDGLFLSKNGGETWERTNFTSQRIYGIAINRTNSDSFYVSGVWNGRGKIFHTENRGIDWKEVYSEPSDGAVVSALKISPKNPSIIYAGTSEGMIFKTIDGGKNWINLYKASGPIVKIDFDSAKEEAVFFAVFEVGLLRTMDNGETFEDINEKIRKNGFNVGVQTIVADPTGSGVIYLGVKGDILRSDDFGDTWKNLNILETSRKFPIKSIAINPKNSKEIFYSSSLVLYKTMDGGRQWSTYQLDSPMSIQLIEYDPHNPQNIYAGFRKK